MPPQSLLDWLPEIAKALDFVHSQRHIHRDVKPANILFDRHGNAFLGDFGIIKGLVAEDADWRANSLTAPGFLVGTPSYVAPEIVMGKPFDGRVDQYSLAMTVHEVLSGSNCMEGPTPSATVVNQTMVTPPALTELIPGIPVPASDAILRGLAKNPAERFENCVSLAHEILTALPEGNKSSGLLKLGNMSTPSASKPATIFLDGPDLEADLNPSAATVPAERPAEFVGGASAWRGRPYNALAVIGLGCVLAVGVLTLVLAGGRRGASGLPPRDHDDSARAPCRRLSHRFNPAERPSQTPPSLSKSILRSAPRSSTGWRTRQPSFKTRRWAVESKSISMAWDQWKQRGR